MIIRKSLEFAAHLVAGVLLGALAVGLARSCGCTRGAGPSDQRSASPAGPEESGSSGL